MRSRRCYRNHLGVRGRVLQHLDLVRAFPNHLSFMHNHSADGNFIPLQRKFGFPQRKFHPVFVLFLVSDWHREV
jgi:hypothetical protein